MTLYYFGIYDNNGGLENFAKNLLTSIKNLDNQINIVIISTVQNLSYRDLFEKIGCQIIYLTNPHEHPLRFYKELLLLLKKHNPNDVLQLNICSYRNPLLFRAAKKSKIKTIIVGHYTKVDDGKLKILHYLNRERFKNFGTLVTNSDDVTNFMFSKKKTPYFIDNGVDLSRFSFNKEKRALLRKSLGVGENVVIGQIGRLSKEKNQLFSVRLFEQLILTDKKYRLFLVGKEMTDDASKYVKEHNLSQYVVFTGAVGNVEDYYSMFDVCLLPSLNEGMSLSLLECCSNGVASIFSEAVPKLKVKCPNVEYLPLEIDLWQKHIIDLKILPNQLLERESSLMGSVYDLKVFAKKYLDLYRN